MIKEVLRNKQAVTGLAMVAAVTLIALFAPMIVPNSPTDTNIMNTFASSCSDYPLGTDEMGRCVLSRLVYGARNSLAVAIPTLLILALISTLIATVCAYIGGAVDHVFSVIIDILMAFPPMLIAITLAGSLGNGYHSILLSVVISMWVWFARIIRTFILAEKSKPYILACRISGCTEAHIVLRHLLPNILPQLIVYFSTGIASIIITISSYAFLGIGFETGAAEWGAMFSSASQYLFSHPSLVIYPGLCILFTAAGFNLFGEALRDIISPEEG